MSEQPQDETTLEELARRRSWFAKYSATLGEDPSGLPLRCPCCFWKTLAERGGFEICPVCSWEDDGQDDHDADVVRGGPNGKLSLTQARSNYRSCGACVRSPEPGEAPGDCTN
ncbi:MAG: CPCC family cysteine-rich protein [Planctomycetota bacterium]